jgi:hypothetical protein
MSMGRTHVSAPVARPRGFPTLTLTPILSIIGNKNTGGSDPPRR